MAVISLETSVWTDTDPLMALLIAACALFRVACFFWLNHWLIAPVMASPNTRAAYPPRTPTLSITTLEYERLVAWTFQFRVFALFDSQTRKVPRSVMVARPSALADHSCTPA